MRDSKGRFKKGHKKTRRARPKRNPSAPRRRRARRAAPTRNPAPRRRRRRAYASNPAPRRRRRRSYRRNPGTSIGGWLVAGAAAVATTLAAGFLLPKIVPVSIQQNSLLYGGLIIAGGVGAGIGLTKLGHPTAAVGIGLPIVTLGGFLAYVGISAAMSKPAVAANPNRAFRSAHRAAQAQIPGPTMGALAAYTPARGMGAVFQNSYPTMAAVESMIGDASMRPVSYSRAGYELGAR